MALSAGSLLKEPEHDPNDAVLQCTFYMKEKRFRFNIKFPGLEGNINASKHNEQELSDMMVKALRLQFGPRVDIL